MSQEITQDLIKSIETIEVETDLLYDKEFVDSVLNQIDQTHVRTTLADGTNSPQRFKDNTQFIIVALVSFYHVQGAVQTKEFGAGKVTAKRKARITYIDKKGNWVTKKSEDEYKALEKEYKEDQALLTTDSENAALRKEVEKLFDKMKAHTKANYQEKTEEKTIDIIISLEITNADLRKVLSSKTTKSKVAVEYKVRGFLKSMTSIYRVDHMIEAAKEEIRRLGTRDKQLAGLKRIKYFKQSNLFGKLMGQYPGNIEDSVYFNDFLDLPSYNCPNAIIRLLDEHLRTHSKG
jgi:hypothetical protein